MMNSILACRCSNCYDTYNLEEVIKDMTYYEMEQFFLEPKTCLRCNKQYLPFGSTYNMYDFVFDAVRNVKM